MAAPIRFHKTRRAHAANVYRLVGRDEDALTYALGHLMAIDDRFMIEVLKRIGVLQRIPGKQHKAYRRNYAIHLQELREIGPSGRRDIAIQAGGPNGLRAVVEAKIGKGQPDACQLLRYTVGCDCHKLSPRTRNQIAQAWENWNEKFIVALTRDSLDSGVRRKVEGRLNGSGIKLRTAQWHQILEVALDRRQQLQVDTPQWLFLSEFLNFFREHYEMKYYEAEVLIRDVNAGNAQVYWEGHMYIGTERFRIAPLYLVPYFTRENNQQGITHVSRVLHVDTAETHDGATAIIQRFENYFAQKPALEDHWRKWWKTGLESITRWYADEEKKGNNWTMRLYFLGEPVKIRETPLKKARNFPQIPVNYGKNITLLDLITAKVLGKEAPS